MNWRALRTAGLVAAALLCGTGLAEAGPKRSETVYPIDVVETDGALPVAGGHLTLGPGRTARCRITGYGVSRGFRYAFEMRGRLKLDANRTQITRGVLSGTAYWIKRTPKGRSVARERIRGSVDGAFDLAGGATLSWRIDRRGPAWGGTLRVGTPGELTLVRADALASLVHVDGDGGNDSMPAYGFDANHVSRRAKTSVDGTVARRHVRAVRSRDLGSAGAYHGIYRATWRVGGERRAGLGVVTIGARGTVAALAPETRVLHADGNTTLRRDGANVEITVENGTPPQLRPGDILASSLGDGVLGRVRGIAPTDERTYVAIVDPVALSEAVQEGELSFDPAEAIDAAGKAASVRAGLEARYHLSHTPAFSAGPVSVAVPLSADLDAALTMRGKISRSGVDEFELRGGVSLDADVALEIVSGGTAAIDQEYPAFDSGPRPFYGHVGIVPVVGTTRWKVLVRVEGEMHASATYTTGIHIEEQLELGFRYDRSQGWQTISDHTHTASYDAPSWTYEYPEGHVRVSVVPVLEVKLYGTVGASIEPYLFGEFEAAMSNDQGDLWMDWDLSAGFGVDARLHAGLFDVRFIDRSWNLIPDKTVLYREGSVLVWEAPEAPADPPADDPPADDPPADPGDDDPDPGSTTADVVVPRVNYAGVIMDGQIGASEWSDAWSSTETFANRNGGPSITCTVKMKHDGSFLYVALATPLANGWDSKGRLRIDGDGSGTLNGQSYGTYVDVQVEQGAPSAWGGYTNYMALLGTTSSQYVHVTPGNGYATASSGSGDVSYEFKVPLSDLGAQTGSTLRLIVTASPSGTAMWHWPAADATAGGPATPGIWSELLLGQ